jgi:glycosyltransferase involved in cell wall biosynthesis
MRIALVSQEYPPETAKGGIGSQTYLKAHGLKALGHEVHVITRLVKTKPGRRDDNGVQVTRAPGSASLTVYSEAADWLCYSGEVAVAVEALHARAPIDIIDFPEWGGEGYVHMLNRTEWNSIPTVVQLHGPLVMFAHTLGWPAVNSEFYRTGTMMEAASVRLADAVFSSSRCSAEWCAQHYGVAHERISILHTGVDTELFAPLSVPKPDRPTIVFAGKLVRNKGVHLLVEAACKLVHEFPGLHLRLLGRGDKNIIVELQSRAAAAGFPALLDLPGFVDREDLPEHFSRAHVFAAPSEYEGGPGFVYLEAMACGLPVIGCAGSGASEVIRDGENGLLVQPKDLDALIAALRALLGNKAERFAMGERARCFVLEEADSRDCLKKLEGFYESVIENKIGVMR